jgi:hypothetical protein
MEFSVTEPRRFSGSAVLVLNALGLLLIVPVLISFLAVSAVQLSLLTFLVPLAVVALTVLFLPLGFGNPYVSRVVRSLEPAAEDESANFIVQLTTVPRLRGGVRALIEDADDVGWLTVGPDRLSFRGDSVRLSVPRERLGKVALKNIGWRGLFLYGSRVMITVPDLPNVQAVLFAERSSWLLPGSRRESRRLYERLAALGEPGRGPKT